MVYATSQLNLPRTLLLNAIFVAALVEVITIPLFGWLSDHIGRRIFYFLGTLFTACFAFPLFWLLSTKDPQIIILTVVVALSFGHGTMFGLRGERPLGIPTIRDRVVQTAAKLVLEPIFEADFEDSAYGYRPARGAVDAVREVHRHVCRGYTDVVDADLSCYFDSIPHDELLRSVARRIVDRHVLGLIKLWLKAPIEERDDGEGTRRIGGGKSNPRGTPQGGVASPMLANIYMNRFLKYWRLTRRGEAFRAHVVAYADDFVILSRGRAAEALTWTKAVMTRLGLTINEAKTSLKNARQERFDFLGYSFGPHRYKANGKWYLSASPSKKGVRRLKTKVSNLLLSGNNDPWPEVRDALNRSLLGWSNYFCHGTCRSAFRGIDRYVYERVRDFLARRHKMAGRGTKRFSRDVVYGARGLLRLERRPFNAPSCAVR